MHKRLRDGTMRRVSLVPRLSAKDDEAKEEWCSLTVGEKGGLGKLPLLELVQSCKQT